MIKNVYRELLAFEMAYICYNYLVISIEEFVVFKIGAYKNIRSGTDGRNRSEVRDDGARATDVPVSDPPFLLNLRA